VLPTVFPTNVKSPENAIAPDGATISKKTSWKPPAFMVQKNNLYHYLPEGAVGGVTKLLEKHRVRITIKRKRVSKLGDYRPPSRDGIHRISINGDLNPFSFLLTMLHEIAHLKVWDRYGRKVKPHGKEWKQAFTSIALPFIEDGVFPDELASPLGDYFLNPPASTFSNPVISKLLAGYDNESDSVMLETLPAQSLFRIHNGKTFRKLEKIRKNYRCFCIDNKKYYTIKPIALVKTLNNAGE
jgi:hypothetical protein